MLYNLLAPLHDDFILFNLFRYLTFRTGCAIMTSMAICFIFGPLFINWLRSKQGKGQPIRAEGPESHFSKAGTPTMGGLMIVFSVTLSTLLWSDLYNAYVWFALLVFVGYAVIGFWDDYLKLTKQNTKGLSGRYKIIGQLVIGALFIYGIMQLAPDNLRTSVAVPFLKDVLVPLGVYLYVPFAMCVIIGASNAVNLTDGLDGLAIVPAALCAACFGIICYLVGNAVFSEYLHIHFVPGTGEIAVLCGALIGAALGFLWFNAPPAMIFMGDTGSLAIGGVLGAMALITKHELILAIMGGLFVVEALSVMAQVLSFKLTGKRIFKMAPIHHHYEKMGWSEPTIVIRFWIVSVILALLALSTLKLR